MFSTDTDATFEDFIFLKYIWKAPSFCWLPLLLFCSAQEVKEHPFFKGIDWQQVYLQKVRN